MRLSSRPGGMCEGGADATWRCTLKRAHAFGREWRRSATRSYSKTLSRFDNVVGHCIVSRMLLLEFEVVMRAAGQVLNPHVTEKATDASPPWSNVFYN